MTLGTLPRRLAVFLLESAISIAPSDAADWGQAMMGELTQFESDWSALLWSFGGAGVLAKHAIVAIVFPRRNRPVPSGGSLFSKAGLMRKTALYATVSCMLASLLFFLVPVFREAFHVSLAQWHDVLHVSPVGNLRSDPGLESLGRKAEQNQDAEALAFVAVRTLNKSESARLADDAVRLDPTLTWVYGVVAVDWSSFPALDRWAPALERFDPQNALPHLIAAERIDIDYEERGLVPHSVDEEPAAWKDAMAAAFRSPKLDTYSKQLDELTRRVALRYKINDPFHFVLDYRWHAVPTFAATDSARYAESLFAAAEAREARGDYKSAFENYSTVVRFAEIMRENGSYPMARRLHEAFLRLGSLSEKEGNHQQAQLYAFLAGTADWEWNERMAFLRTSPEVVSRWSAFLARVCGIALLLSGTAFLVCVTSLVVRRRSLRLAALQPKGMTLAFGLASTVTALLSSAMLYVSYRPYAEVVQRFIRTGDESQLPAVSEFLAYAQIPLGTGRNLGWGLSAQEVTFYFWLAVAGLCVLTLLLAVWRFWRRPRGNATT